MSKSIECIVFGGVAACLLCGIAFAEPKAPVVWQPPAEIAGKPAAPAEGAATPGTPTAASTAAPVDSMVAREEACAAQAREKGLKRGKKRAFIAQCRGK